MSVQPQPFFARRATRRVAAVSFVLGTVLAAIVIFSGAEGIGAPSLFGILAPLGPGPTPGAACRGVGCGHGDGCKCGGAGCEQGCTGCNDDCPVWGVACGQNGCCESRWKDARPIPWASFAQGEYVGPARTAHIPTYYIRVDDQIDCVYRLTREETSTPYHLNVGDEVRVSSFTDEKIDSNLTIQPDGSITLPLLGEVQAARRTIAELRLSLEDQYKQFYKVPAITVTPLKMNTRLEDLRNAVDNRSGIVGGQGIRVRVTPDGTVQLPALGSVPVQGLTLDEMKREIDERYHKTIQGIEVTPVLSERAPRYVYVLGEVALPGRYTLEAPTTVMQAIALAGSWNVGANLTQVVVFRRDENWQLMATMLNLYGALHANRPCPADEIWLSDSDIIVIPKSQLRLANEVIDQVFTRGLYGVVPFSSNLSLNVLDPAGGLR